jgi:hypothetical protein
MTKPDKLPSHHREHLHDLLARCPQLTVLADRVREFAGLLTARRGHDLDAWMTTSPATTCPHCTPSSTACAWIYQQSWRG